MAHVRDSARTFGKSDPIDALAVARAVLREPDLPTARLDDPDRDVRLLGDHREALVAERTRVINRLRWHLHELDPGWDPAPRSLDRVSAYDKITVRLGDHDDNLAGSAMLVARLARRLVERARTLTVEIDELTAELTQHVQALAPTLLAVPGCGVLTAAKILGGDRGDRPVHLERCLRSPQRDRTAAGVVIDQGPSPPLPHREPAAQRRAAPHRAYSGPLSSRGQDHDRPAEG
jgi:transposase